MAHSFHKGQRVELSPATDRWMMGDRYGTIVGVSKSGGWRVKLDRSHKTFAFHTSNLMHVDDRNCTCRGGSGLLKRHLHVQKAIRHIKRGYGHADRALQSGMAAVGNALGLGAKKRGRR